MKTRTTVLTLGNAVCRPDDVLRRKPKPGDLETQRSQVEDELPESPKNLTVTYEAVGDNIKATVDGVDGQGKPTHNEWTGKFDGKDYPVTGDPTSDTRSYQA